MPRPIVLIFFALLACTRPYATPEVSPDLPFDGARAYFSPAGDPVLRVVFTHGMCSDAHRAVSPDPDTPSWLEERRDALIKALAAKNSEPPASLTVYPARSPGDDSPRVERYTVMIDLSEGGRVQADFLIWGRHVDANRQALEFDNTRAQDGDADAPQRARLNTTARRELMNRCLIDAVVYLGTSGDAIRRGMREAVCDILGGRFTPASPPGAAADSARCTPPRGAPGPGTVLIPESLGSTILFDAITSLSGGPTLDTQLGSLRSVYLGANQLPLLRQGNVREDEAALRDATTAPADSLEAFLARIAQAQPVAQRTLDTGTPPAKPQLIAITDPNDILGYRLDPALFDSYPYSAFDIRNVLVSNTAVIAGLVADPIEAHQGTANETVFGMIANGWPPPAE